MHFQKNVKLTLIASSRSNIHVSMSLLETDDHLHVRSIPAPERLRVNAQLKRRVIGSLLFDEVWLLKVNRRIHL